MLRPAKPRSAGSSVTEATIVMSTARDTVKAKPLRAACPTSTMPSMETRTVRPARTTARPAVAIAVSVASRGSCPRPGCCGTGSR